MSAGLDPICRVPHTRPHPRRPRPRPRPPSCLRCGRDWRTTILTWTPSTGSPSGGATSTLPPAAPPSRSPSAPFAPTTPRQDQILIKQENILIALVHCKLRLYNAQARPPLPANPPLSCGILAVVRSYGCPRALVLPSPFHPAPWHPCPRAPRAPWPQATVLLRPAFWSALLTAAPVPPGPRRRCCCGRPSGRPSFPQRCRAVSRTFGDPTSPSPSSGHRATASASLPRRCVWRSYSAQPTLWTVRLAILLGPAHPLDGEFGDPT